MPAPAPIGPVIGFAIIIARRRSVIGWLLHPHIARVRIDRPIAHIARLAPRGLTRNATAHVERRLDGEALLVLPGHLAPAVRALAGVDQAAAGNLGNDVAFGAGRGAQVDG